MNYDIFLVGVGGQGILTIGEILSAAAESKGMPVNFFPSRGMAQRGGFVKAQLRLGRVVVGPNIPEKGADLVVAMELSEALKTIRYVKPGGNFVLFGDIWPPTAVVLGQQSYPPAEQVQAQVNSSGARLIYIPPQIVPYYQRAPAAANIFILGAALGMTPLRQLFAPEEVDRAILERWQKQAEANHFAFQSGLAFARAQQGEAAGVSEGYR